MPCANKSEWVRGDAAGTIAEDAAGGFGLRVGFGRGDLVFERKIRIIAKPGLPG